MAPNNEQRDAIFKTFGRAFFKQDLDLMYEAVAPDFTWTVQDEDVVHVLDSREKIADFFEQRRGRFENVRFDDVVFHHAPEETFMTYRMTGTVVATADGPDGNVWALSDSVLLRGCRNVTRYVHAAAPQPAAHLSALSNRAVGGSVTIGFVAATGDVVVPWLSFRLLGSPVSTPFGSLWVPLDAVLPALTVRGDDRVYAALPVPDDSSLLGQTLHLQAGAAGSGGTARTNPASLTLR